MGSAQGTDIPELESAITRLQQAKVEGQRMAEAENRIADEEFRQTQAGYWNQIAGLREWIRRDQTALVSERSPRARQEIMEAIREHQQELAQLSREATSNPRPIHRSFDSAQIDREIAALRNQIASVRSEKSNAQTSAASEAASMRIKAATDAVAREISRGIDRRRSSDGGSYVEPIPDDSGAVLAEIGPERDVTRSQVSNWSSESELSDNTSGNSQVVSTAQKFWTLKESFTNLETALVEVGEGKVADFKERAKVAMMYGIDASELGEKGVINVLPDLVKGFMGNEQQAKNASEANSAAIQKVQGKINEHAAELRPEIYLPQTARKVLADLDSFVSSLFEEK